MNACVDWTTVMLMLNVITLLEVMCVRVTKVFGEMADIVMVSLSCVVNNASKFGHLMSEIFLK